MEHGNAAPGLGIGEHTALRQGRGEDSNSRARVNAAGGCRLDPDAWPGGDLAARGCVA